MLPQMEIEARFEHSERVRMEVVTVLFCRRWLHRPCLLHFKVSRDVTNGNANVAFVDAM